MLDFLFTLVTFNVVLFLLPAVCFTYFVSKLGRSIWLSCLSIVHSDVEFLEKHTINTLLDTHRNQGIICVLLKVAGPVEYNAVKRHLQELVRRKEKSGKLAFPRLRECLVTRCSNYAWKKCNFELSQNLTLASSTFKGRTITDFNIQEYVSDMVSKYLPQNIPPWQILLIPSTEDHHFILVKLHHVLLDEGINVGDLLPLIPPTRPPVGQFVSKSPLVEVCKKPKAIPYLKDKLTEEFSNFWNEFLSAYDPLENTNFLKNTPGFFQFLAIILITVVSISKETKKGFRFIKNDVFSKIKYISCTVRRETSKREVSVLALIKSIFVTLDPRNLITSFIKNSWELFLTLTIRLPSLLYAELVSLYTCFSLQYCIYPNTCVGYIYNYVPLFYDAFKEVWYFWTIVFHSPKNILQDVLLQEESLQTVTLCGRKSVAWSEPVKIEVIRSISKVTGTSETEILLSAISHALSQYLLQTTFKVPSEMSISIRNINSNYVFATGANVRPEDSLSGILSMNLPLMHSDKDMAFLTTLLEIKHNFQATLRKQGLSHTLTILQTRFRILAKFVPSTLLGIYLKYLSRKFAVTVTEVTSRYPNMTQQTLWGQEVTSAIYWRPPQANTCISLCLNEYSDHVRLGVMCDSQLVPYHSFLARFFTVGIQNLQKVVGIE